MEKMIDTHLIELLKKAEGDGAGEILLTNIDKEGMQSGYDIELYQNIQNSISIPIVAHEVVKIFHQLIIYLKILL